MTRPTRAIVDLDAIAGNFRVLAERAGGPGRVFPVLKANAYGHGAVPVARRLAEEGAVRFAVALVEEGIELRAAGIPGEILLLSSGARGDAPLLAAHDLTPTLYDVEQARTLAATAAGLETPLPVHLNIDTGMGRLGVRPDDLSRMIGVLKRSPSLRLAGTFTHLARADEPESDSTARQIDLFSEALSRIRTAGLHPGLVHAANSAGALAVPAALFDATRPGIALFGIAPSERVGHPALRPALTLETEILAVQRVPPGTALGYGGTFMTSRPTDVVTLPI
ncbi:MAG: alanine racemase, partial [Acidobacteriota bacterium]